MAACDSGEDVTSRQAKINAHSVAAVVAAAAAMSTQRSSDITSRLFAPLSLKNGHHNNNK